MENTSGHFFFRPETQSNNWNVQRFSYKKIIRKNDEKNLAQVETDFPIYVVISTETISFRCSARHNSITDNKPYPAHYGTGHIQDFSFAIHDGNGIENWLSNQDEIGDQFLDFELYTRTDKAIESTIEERNEQSESGSPKAKYPVDPSFSNITQWCLPVKSEKTLLTRRELALDFLFDLFHSNVFNSHPSIQKLKAVLLDTPFSRAIVAKGNFYYFQALLFENYKNRGIFKLKSIYNRCQKWFLEPFYKFLPPPKPSRQLLPDPWKHQDDEKKRNCSESEKKWLSEQLKLAAQTWITVIRDKSITVIQPDLEKKEDEQWFKDVETEYNEIYFKLPAYQVEIPPHEYVTSAQWLLERNNLLGAYMQLTLGVNFLIIIIQFVLFFIGAYLFIFGPFYLYKIIPSHLYDKHYFIAWSPVIWGTLITSSLLAIFFAFSGTSATLLYSIHRYVKKNFLLKKQNAIKQQYSNKPSLSEIIKEAFSIFQLSQILMPKALLAIILVWGWLVDDNRLSLVNKQINLVPSNVLEPNNNHQSFYFLLIFFVLSFSFIVYRLSPQYPMHNNLKKAFRVLSQSFFLLIIGFAYSVIIGCIVFHFFYEKDLEIIGHLCLKFLDDEPVYPLSYTLLFYSALCACFGIVIEMSTQTPTTSNFRKM